MMISINALTWAANGFIVLALLFQYKGKLHFSFLCGLLASILFLTYGVVIKDYAFVVSNGLVFIPLNALGYYTWVRKVQASG